MAISNNRLLGDEDGQVSFDWKDYDERLNPQDDDRCRPTSSSAASSCTFCRQGLQRIRYFGFLANCHRAAKLDLCRNLLATHTSLLLPQFADCREFLTALTHIDLGRCPHCGAGTLNRVIIPPHAPIPPHLDSS